MLDNERRSAKQAPGWMILATALVSTLAACGSVVSDVVVRNVAAPTTTTTTTTVTTRPPRSTTPPTATVPPVSRGSGPTTTSPVTDVTQTYDEVLQLAIDDIQAFWRTTYPAVYKTKFTELGGGIYRAVPSSTNIPGCGSSRTRYRDVQGNAFYCGEGDFIVYDDGQLFPALVDQFGVYAPAVVLAHEFGHAIQSRAAIEGETILLEQNADCNAGAWLAHVARGETPGLAVGETELNNALAGMLAYADPVGTSSGQKGAHGSGFDRVGAFQDGYTNGAARCAQYVTKPPATIELPFLSSADVQSGGNLPFADVIPRMSANLDTFWTKTFQAAGQSWNALAGGLKAFPSGGPYPTCGNSTAGTKLEGKVVYCPTGDFVAYDSDLMSQLYDIGDYAMGIAFGDAWADAAQSRQKSAVTGKARSLQADCYTGAWTKSDIADLSAPATTTTTSNTPTTEDLGALFLSPGDLDEGIQAIIKFGENKASAGSDSSTSFERIAAFRSGVLNGYDACKA